MRKRRSSRGGTVVCEEDPEPSNKKAALVCVNQFQEVHLRLALEYHWYTEPGKAGGAVLRRGGGGYLRLRMWLYCKSPKCLPTK